jgi:hypothetical protein
MSEPEQEIPVGIKWLGRIELTFFGLCWASLGIAAFVQMTILSREYDRRISLITEGKVPAETLYIASIAEREERDPEGQRVKRWDIGFSRDKPDPSKIVEYRSRYSADEATDGEAAIAYRFHNGPKETRGKQPKSNDRYG